tara:strand:+ start:414 stop:881 length:468 start_codon:yes stop_codon:yes gene_type:complete
MPDKKTLSATKADTSHEVDKSSLYEDKSVAENLSDFEPIEMSIHNQEDGKLVYDAAAKAEVWVQTIIDGVKQYTTSLWVTIDYKCKDTGELQRLPVSLSAERIQNHLAMVTPESGVAPYKVTGQNYRLIKDSAVHFEDTGTIRGKFTSMPMSAKA